MSKIIYLLIWAIIFAIGTLTQVVLSYWFAELHALSWPQLTSSAVSAFLITFFLWYGDAPREPH